MHAGKVRVPMGGYGYCFFSPQIPAGRGERVYIKAAGMASNSHQNPTVKMMAVDGHVDIFSVDMEEESERPEEKKEKKKEEGEDRKCVICL